MSSAPRFDRIGVDPMPARPPKAFKWRWLDAVRAEDSGLTSTETAIAVAHGLFADDDGRRVFPGTTLIARQTKFNIKTVEKVRRKLETDRWLRCVVRGGLEGEWKTKNEYVLTIPPAVDNCAVPPAHDTSTPRSGRVVAERPPAHDSRPPAHDGGTPRPGEDLVTREEPDDQPSREGPPAQDGGSKLQPDVVRLGSAHASAIRAALDAGRAAS